MYLVVLWQISAAQPILFYCSILTQITYNKQLFRSNGKSSGIQELSQDRPLSVWRHVCSFFVKSLLRLLYLIPDTDFCYYVFLILLCYCSIRAAPCIQSEYYYVECTIGLTRSMYSGIQKGRLRMEVSSSFVIIFSFAVVITFTLSN